MSTACTALPPYLISTKAQTKGAGCPQSPQPHIRPAHSDLCTPIFSWGEPPQRDTSKHAYRRVVLSSTFSRHISPSQQACMLTYMPLKSHLAYAARLHTLLLIKDSSFANMSHSPLMPDHLSVAGVAASHDEGTYLSFFKHPQETLTISCLQQSRAIGIKLLVLT